MNFTHFFPLFLPLIQSPSVCYEQNNISFCKLLDYKPMAKLDCFLFPKTTHFLFASYEQTSIYLYACAATVIAAIIFSKGSPYRQPLYRNGQFLKKSRSEGFLLLLPVIMSIWAAAAIATVFFMCLYKSEVRIPFEVFISKNFNLIGP